MDMTHKEAVVVGKIINILLTMPLLEGDFECDNVRLYFFLTRIAKLPSASVYQDVELTSEGREIINLLRNHDLPDAKRLLEIARYGTWGGFFGAQDEIPVSERTSCKTFEEIFAEENEDKNSINGSNKRTDHTNIINIRNIVRKKS
jgi:hypothetical protein